MTYPEAILYLYGLERFGWKLGLERMLGLLSDLDNPHKQLKCIHVAGTNGKGSVSAMLASILTKSGYKTGLYTSPHLIDARERIQINSLPISKKELVEIVTQLIPLFDKYNITFFEAFTAICFVYFAQNKIDVAVLEVGLGGRLDATNVIRPIQTIITSIDYDHTEHLGNNLRDIAAEKAGILKQHVPCVIGNMSDESLQKIKNVASDLNVPLLYNLCSDKVTIIKESENGTTFTLQDQQQERFFIKFVGQHQVENACIAKTSAQKLKHTFPLVNDITIYQGLSSAQWPGRFQIISQSPKVILDVAHNAASMKKLVDLLLKFYRGKKVNFLFGILQDKNIAAVLDEINRIASFIYIAEPHTPRALDGGTLEEKISLLEIKHKRIGPVKDGLYGVIQETSKDHILCITGSHYIVGEAISEIKNLTQTGIINKLFCSF